MFFLKYNIDKKTSLKELIFILQKVIMTAQIYSTAI